MRSRKELEKSSLKQLDKNYGDEDKPKIEDLDTKIEILLDIRDLLLIQKEKRK